MSFSTRHKVKELIEFIQDDEKLREERKKAKKNKDKYVGMSSDAIGVRGFGMLCNWFFSSLLVFVCLHLTLNPCFVSFLIFVIFEALQR